MDSKHHNDETIVLKEEDYTKVFELEKGFKQVKKLNDPRFGEVRLFQHPDTMAVVAVKEIRLNDKKQAEKEIIKCKRRLKIWNQYVLPLIDYSIEKQSSLCSSFYLLKLYYEYPPTDLKNELAQKKKKGEYFSTEELLHLLYQQVEAHKYLELTRSFHGDVRPVFWGLNSGLWHSKLIYKPEDIDSVQTALKAQLAHLQFGDPVYQSPMLYEKLMSKNLKFEYSPNKEDMFATALVLIELGTQDSIQNVYGKNGKFDHEAMRTHVAKFEHIYNGADNQLLVTSVLTMLEPEESKRPHFILLHERMPSYYAVVKHFENLRDDPSYVSDNLLQSFIYIDKTIIEGFTLQPGVRQVKVHEKPNDLSQTTRVNPTYSNRNIGAPVDNLHGTGYIGSGKIIERIIRRFEERDGVMIERVEHFNVTDDDKLIKTEEYELVNGKKLNDKYFDPTGVELPKVEGKGDGVKVKKTSKSIEKGGVKEKKDQKKLSINGGLNKSIEKHKKGSFNRVKDLTGTEGAEKKRKSSHKSKDNEIQHHEEQKEELHKGHKEDHHEEHREEREEKHHIENHKEHTEHKDTSERSVHRDHNEHHEHHKKHEEHEVNKHHEIHESHEKHDKIDNERDDETHADD